jgi:DNA-binding response OmpR family regulator
MDVKLPDMDGFDVTRIIKSQRGTGSIPVVLMSSRLDRNHFAFGIQTGAADFLSMPLVLDSMIARLWNILQHRGFIPPAGNDTLNAALRDALSSDTPHSGVRYGAEPR